MSIEEVVNAAYPIYEPDNSIGGPTPAQENAVALKHMFRTLHTAILLRCDNSRSRSEALTCLETAGMWAVKAAHQDASVRKEDASPPGSQRPSVLDTLNKEAPQSPQD